LLFVWHAGEELGLYGSEYFVDHPTVPLDHIVAQLNIDMIGRNHDNLESESNTIYTVGADRISTELHNILVDANASMTKPMSINFQLNDPTDSERIYYRSDHYSYAAKGIPIIFFTTFLHPDYHRPSDEVEKINFEKMAHVVQLVYETGRRVANLDHAPVRDNKGPRVGRGGQGKILTSN
jgi:Zn-dependent M28 family amino/carboxypeptidase